MNFILDCRQIWDEQEELEMDYIAWFTMVLETLFDAACSSAPVHALGFSFFWHDARKIQSLHSKLLALASSSRSSTLLVFENVIDLQVLWSEYGPGFELWYGYDSFPSEDARDDAEVIVNPDRKELLFKVR